MMLYAVGMDLYTQAVSADKRIASGRQAEMLLVGKILSTVRTAGFWAVTYSSHKTNDSYWFMAGTTGLEPATSAVTDKFMTVTH
jgi:hypothetical protein